MNEIFKYKTPGDSTGFLLWKVTNRWQRELKKRLKKYDLTHTQFVILASTFYLNQDKDNITQVDIARFIDIDKMMTSNVIRKLISKEFVTRKEHETDTRAKVISLTKPGIDTLKKAIQEVEQFDTDFFGEITEKRSFNMELGKLL